MSFSSTLCPRLVGTVNIHNKDHRQFGPAFTVRVVLGERTATFITQYPTDAEAPPDPTAELLINLPEANLNFTELVSLKENSNDNEVSKVNKAFTDTYLEQVLALSRERRENLKHNTRTQKVALVDAYEIIVMYGMKARKNPNVHLEAFINNSSVSLKEWLERIDETNIRYCRERKKKYGKIRLDNRKIFGKASIMGGLMKELGTPDLKGFGELLIAAAKGKRITKQTLLQRREQLTEREEIDRLVTEEELQREQREAANSREENAVPIKLSPDANYAEVAKAYAAEILARQAKTPQQLREEAEAETERLKKKFAMMGGSEEASAPSSASAPASAVAEASAPASAPTSAKGEEEGGGGREEEEEGEEKEGGETSTNAGKKVLL